MCKICKPAAPSILCCKCDWKGEEEDLVRGQDGRGAFDGCPVCNTDEYLKDME